MTLILVIIMVTVKKLILTKVLEISNLSEDLVTLDSL